jgi:hypothetical protein
MTMPLDEHKPVEEPNLVVQQEARSLERTDRTPTIGGQMSSEKMNSERSKPENSEVRSGGDGPSGRIEQRQHPRYDFSVPVFVRVLIEEETFNPLRFPGRTRNRGVQDIF